MRFSFLSCAFFLGVTQALPADRFSSRNVHRAAVSMTKLIQRSPKLHFSHEADFPFVDSENVSVDKKVFATTLHVKSDDWIFPLEDSDHLLKNVYCYTGTIRLVFHSAEASSEAQATLESGNAYIITSNEGCNKDGGRAVYKVDYVTAMESDTLSIRTTRISWKKAFPKISVTFDHTIARHSFLNARRLSSSIPSNPYDLSGGPLLPRGPSNVTTQTTDISATFIDKPLPLPIDLPIELSCKNCTTTGTFVMKYGHFDFDFSFDPEDWIQSGFFDVEVNDFLAYILLSIEPKSMKHWTVDLYSKTLMPLDIPDVLTMNLFADFALQGSLTFGGHIEVDFGFEMTVPNDSKLHVDFGTFSASSLTGFPDTTVDMIPFQADIENPSANIVAGLRSRLAFEMNFDIVDTFELSDDDETDLSAEIYVDLPVLHTNVSQVSNVDAHCKPLSESNESADIIEDTFDNLTLIASKVSLDFGFDAKHDGDKVIGDRVWGTAWPLPTMCLNWDSDTDSFGSAQADYNEAVENLARASFNNPFAVAKLGWGFDLCAAAVMVFATGTAAMALI